MRICIVKDCRLKYYGKGYCHKHYHNYKRCGNPLGKKNGKLLGKFIKCFNCGKKIYRYLHQFKKYKKFFCSYKCSVHKKNNPNWRGGTAEYPNHYLMKKQRLIILMNNHECEICGKPATEIHHKNGNKADHRLSNLVAICHKCNLGIRFRPNNTPFYQKYKMSSYQMAKRLNISYSILYRLRKQNVLDSVLKSNSLILKG